MPTATPEAFRFKTPFAISRGVRTEVRVVTVRVAREGVEGRVEGWAECVPYPRYGETVEGVAAAIGALPETLTRTALQDLLPPGAARNGVDCALWDLEAKAQGRPAWALTGLARPEPLITAFTLSLDAPDRMEAAARAAADRPVLKVKLGAGEEDVARIEAVRRGAPDARIIVDANEGWTADLYAALAPHLVRLGVALVEQPLPAGKDEALAHMVRPLPVCADESCHDRASLPALRGRYDLVNIKLDKTGGLTEALALRDAARTAGFGIMVGCMAATSLAMAPAVLVAQGADVVDLDGPLLLADDRAAPLRYEGSRVWPAGPELWG